MKNLTDYPDDFELDPASSTEEPKELQLDAYGHMNWTVGNEDWVACFDARRNGDRIEYHVVVDCESGGFVDTMEHGFVLLAEAVATLSQLPGVWADVCSENYMDSRKREHRVKVRETAKTRKAWSAHVASLVALGPCGEDGTENSLCGVCSDCQEQGPDPVRDGWVGSDGRP